MVFEVSTNLIMNCYLALYFSLSLSNNNRVFSNEVVLFYSNKHPISLFLFLVLGDFFPLGPRGGVVVFGHRGGGESRKEEASSSHIEYQFVHL
jgi:hypothetical protein